MLVLTTSGAFIFQLFHTFKTGIDDTEEQQAADEAEEMPPLEGDGDEDDASKMEEVD